MRKQATTLLLILMMTCALFARTKIDNIQFTDLDGNSYDLYEMLGKGHYILIHMQFNN